MIKLPVEFQISHTTVNDIKKNADKIENYMTKVEVTDEDVRKRRE